MSFGHLTCIGTSYNWSHKPHPQNPAHASKGTQKPIDIWGLPATVCTSYPGCLRIAVTTDYILIYIIIIINLLFLLFDQGDQRKEINHTITKRS